SKRKSAGAGAAAGTDGEEGAVRGKDEKPKRKRRKQNEEYDRNDPFVDDTELAWQEHAAATKDGFFVYSGPLVPEGEKVVVEKADGKTRRPRASRGGRAASGTTRDRNKDRDNDASGPDATTTSRARTGGARTVSNRTVLAGATHVNTLAAEEAANTTASDRDGKDKPAGTRAPNKTKAEREQERKEREEKRARREKEREEKRAERERKSAEKERERARKEAERGRREAERSERAAAAAAAQISAGGTVFFLAGNQSFWKSN
ncbi:hypothetical protein KEM55_001423, partial [Ascosphaera atra]